MRGASESRALMMEAAAKGGVVSVGVCASGFVAITVSAQRPSDRAFVVVQRQVGADAMDADDPVGWCRSVADGAAGEFGRRFGKG